MSDIKQILQNQRNYFSNGQPKELSVRLEKLKILRQAIITNEAAILEALKQDLNKSAFEAYETEVGIVLDELKFTIKNLPKWFKPKPVKTPITHFIASSHIYPEPYGVVLIMSPWNYPFQLTIAPLIGAIAAGNCALIKPSAYAPHTSGIIAHMVREFFDEEYIAVIEGGRAANEALLEERFDYIFFTGSVNVGKNVMAAAAKHLTPVTLELGGKSPCIVDKNIDVNLAARRIVWGKFLNAGQTCVAVDYLLVPKDVKPELLKAISHWIKMFYGTDPSQSPDFPKIINRKHLERLIGLLASGEKITGGNVDQDRLYFSPTVLDNVTWDDPVMQEEIFGPILPVLEYDDLLEVIDMVNKRPKPLALYFFSNSRKNQQRVIREISFGGGCINDTIVHLATPYMPFGGVGSSGMGGYHGKASFDTFSHFKSILKKSMALDLPVRYPPYKNKIKLLKQILK
jgi:aldehyde dehydrogenase (NAD+)